MFIYPEFKPHAPYRILTRDNEMVYEQDLLWHKPKNVPAKVAFPDGIPSFVKSQESIDSVFWREGGINLCGGCMLFRNIRPGGIRLRRNVHYVYSSVAQAIEVLSFGVGILRPYQTRQVSAWDCMFGNEALPKVDSRHAKVSLYHLAEYPLSPYELNLLPKRVNKELFESTNIILADSYGELEQLHQRKEDTTFLKRYLKEIRTISGANRKEGSYPEYIQEKGIQLARIWQKHISLGIWKSAPKSIDELIERVDFLLENTTIDDNPIPRITKHEHLHLYQN